MTKDEIQVIVREFEERRKSLPCPIRGACAGCRFRVTAVLKRTVDPKITVIGEKPPDDYELIYKCEFDLISAEVSAMHTQLSDFLKAIQVVQR